MSGRLNVAEPGQAILQFDTFFENAELLVCGPAMNTASVLPVNTTGRVHHLVGQFAVCGQQQQTRSVNIQPANSNPATII